MLAVIVLCLGLIVLSASEINYESEHVLTVCDAFTIWYTKKGESIPECPQLPLATGFFSNLSGKVYEKQCEHNVTNTTSLPQAGLLERGVLILKRLLDDVKDRLEQLGVALFHSAEDVSGLSSVGEKWNHRVYSILVGFCFVLFHLQCKKFHPLLFNVFLSFLTSGLFYFVHLYFRNWLITWFFIVVAIFMGSPLYVKTWLPAIGVMTFIHLAIPLLGLILRLVIEVQLFFGPTLSLLINGFSILIHVICLIGLFIDEKLLIFKVLLLPLYQTFMSLFHHNDQHSELVDSIRRSVDDMTTGLLSSTDFKNKSVQQLNEMLTGRMRQLCTNVTTSWYTSCPVLFARSCTAYINQTELTKVDKGFDAAGQWLTSLIMPSSVGTGSVQRTLSKQICQKISNSACRNIDIAAYCSPDGTLYGQAYHTFLTAVEKLKASVVVQPWLQLNFTLFDSGPTLHISFDTDWVMIGRCIASFFLVISALFLLFRAFIQSAIFVRRYRTDCQFCFGKVSGIHWASAFNIQLLVKVLLFFLSECVVRWTHEELQKIQFTEPEQGYARLAFNVQGNGTIARIMRSMLGGFNLRSKYCTRADSSVCTTPFFPVGWSTWLSLFSLTALYFLTGLYQNKSNYFMCRLCDRFILRACRERKEMRQKYSREECRRKRLVIQILTEEALSRSRLRDNKLVLNFYRSPRRWYHHKLNPSIVQSMVAYYKFGVENIFCQICFHNVVASRFRCKTILFCHECNTYLKRCPCACDSCHKITI